MNKKYNRLYIERVGNGYTVQPMNMNSVNPSVDIFVATDSDRLKDLVHDWCSHHLFFEEEPKAKE